MISKQKLLQWIEDKKFVFAVEDKYAVDYDTLTSQGCLKILSMLERQIELGELEGSKLVLYEPTFGPEGEVDSDAYCPDCERSLGSDVDGCKFCPDCGQSLHWEPKLEDLLDDANKRSIELGEFAVDNGEEVKG